MNRQSDTPNGKYKAAVIFLAIFIIANLVGCATGGSSYHNTAYNNADKAYKKGHYEAAAKYYNKYIEENPNSALIEVCLYYMGKSYQKAGYYDKAKESYSKLIEQYKTDTWVEWAKKDMAKLK